MNLRDELTVLAEGARAYGDPDAAVRTVRQRRIAALVAAPVLAVAAIAAPLILPNWRQAATGVEEPSGGIDLTASGPAPVLPVDRAVGRAAFAYTTQGQTWLVTRDGRRYELPSAAPERGEMSLSPDGRWLVQDDQLRDLTGRLQRSLRGQRVLAWSPNSAMILAEDPLQQQFLVETASGHVDAVRSLPGLAVLDDGSVVDGEGGIEDEDPGPPNVVTLSLLDPGSGAQQREVVIDARGALSGQEAVKGRQGIIRVWFGPDDQALFEVAGGLPPGHSALLASLRAPQRVSAIAGAVGNRRWRPLGFFDDAVLIKSEEQVASGAPDGNPVELRAWRDGDSTLLFLLPPGSAVLPPGGVLAS